MPDLGLASDSQATKVARWFVFIQNSQFGYICEGLGIENVGIIYGHWEYIFVAYATFHFILPVLTLRKSSVYVSKTCFKIGI
jgi:hypothetical protein